jgi:hypothetical protein
LWAGDDELSFMSSNGNMTGERRRMEVVLVAKFEALLRNLHEGTENDHKKITGESVSRPRFEPGNFQM